MFNQNISIKNVTIHMLKIETLQDLPVNLVMLQFLTCDHFNVTYYPPISKFD